MIRNFQSLTAHCATSKSDHALTTSVCHWTCRSLLRSGARHSDTWILGWCCGSNSSLICHCGGCSGGWTCIECGLALNCNDVKLACFTIMSPVAPDLVPDSDSNTQTQYQFQSPVRRRPDASLSTSSLSLFRARFVWQLVRGVFELCKSAKTRRNGLICRAPSIDVILSDLPSIGDVVFNEFFPLLSVPSLFL